MMFYKQKLISVRKISEILEIDEKGVLTVEFSIVFIISVVVTTLVLNLFVFIYIKCYETTLTNESVLEFYQNSDELKTENKISSVKYGKGSIIKKLNGRYLEIN